MWYFGLVLFIVKLGYDCQMGLVFITESTLNATVSAGDAAEE